jgi:hypothetical protein
VLEGLPSLCHYTIASVQQRPGDSMAVVAYHLIGDVINVTDIAMRGWSRSLDDPYMQNTSFASPYIKWATLTNHEFIQVDRCVRRLLNVTRCSYHLNVYQSVRGGQVNDENLPILTSDKDASMWFDALEQRYASCVVSTDRPEVTLGTCHIDACVDAGGWFLNLWNRPGDRSPQPPMAPTTVHAIHDRRVVLELHRKGSDRLRDMREALDRFGAWIRTNCSLESLTVPHQGTLNGL